MITRTNFVLLLFLWPEIPIVQRYKEHDWKEVEDDSERYGTTKWAKSCGARVVERVPEGSDEIARTENAQDDPQRQDLLIVYCLLELTELNLIAFLFDEFDQPDHDEGQHGELHIQ